MKLISSCLLFFLSSNFLHFGKEEIKVFYSNDEDNVSFQKAGTQLPDNTVSHSSVQLKLFLLEAWIGPWKSRSLRLPEFLDNWQFCRHCLYRIITTSVKSRGVKPTTQLILRIKKSCGGTSVTVQTFELGLTANNLPTGVMPPQKSKVMKWALALARWFYKGPRPCSGLKSECFSYKPVFNSFNFSVN
jgi:hypothetical protein